MRTCSTCIHLGKSAEYCNENYKPGLPCWQYDFTHDDENVMKPLPGQTVFDDASWEKCRDSEPASFSMPPPIVGGSD